MERMAINRLFQEEFRLSSQLLHAYRLEFPAMEQANVLSDVYAVIPLRTFAEAVLEDCRLHFGDS